MRPRVTGVLRDTFLAEKMPFKRSKYQSDIFRDANQIEHEWQVQSLVSSEKQTVT